MKRIVPLLIALAVLLAAIFVVLKFAAKRDDGIHGSNVGSDSGRTAAVGTPVNSGPEAENAMAWTSSVAAAARVVLPDRSAVQSNAGEGLTSVTSTPAVAAGNPILQADSIREALKSGQQPERLSPMFLPKEPFDKAAFERDPHAYLNVIEPGRVFATAQPGPDVPSLRTLGPTGFGVKPGVPVKLSVKGAPMAPVTFTAFDLGQFKENGLTCITVQADKDGMAAVTFVGGGTAVNECRVMAGSPLASGQVRFVVDVEAPPIQAVPPRK